MKPNVKKRFEAHERAGNGHLDLSMLSLRSLPSDLDHLPSSVRSISLDSNAIGYIQLEKTPSRAFLQNWKGVVKLSIAWNRLVELPTALGQLSHLQELVLSFNRLSTLPRSIYGLRNLRILRCNDNQLESLDDGIENLANLTEFDVSFNKLSRLPTGFSRMPALSDLNVSGNPLQFPPSEVCLEGIQSIKMFLARDESLDSEDRLFLEASQLVESGPTHSDGSHVSGDDVETEAQPPSLSSPSLSFATPLPSRSGVPPSRDVVEGDPIRRLWTIQSEPQHVDQTRSGTTPSASLSSLSPSASVASRTSTTTSHSSPPRGLSSRSTASPAQRRQRVVRTSLASRPTSTVSSIQHGPSRERMPQHRSPPSAVANAFSVPPATHHGHLPLQTSSFLARQTRNLALFRVSHEDWEDVTSALSRHRRVGLASALQNALLSSSGGDDEEDEDAEEEEDEEEDHELIERFPPISSYSGPSSRHFMHRGRGRGRGRGDRRSSDTLQYVNASSLASSSLASSSRGLRGGFSRSPLRESTRRSPKRNVKDEIKESETLAEEDIVIPDDVNVPSHFLCPISLEMMTDPVVCADGHTYSRASIMRWLKENDRSPMTGEQLPHSFLTPNFTLRSMIVEFREKHGI
eukprot:TRINITY_DN954_c1_g1_i1.p1 TRINITY_DN954_c1_g1~~TRINITY_DN954_c1_g1_i1.p1  ORF type:complete len:632 (+),score=154.74 TRINITY_DN954_c1_g1_i1:87-1982(+)